MKIIINVVNLAIVSTILMLTTGCNESLEQQRFRQYLASINANESAALTAQPTAGMAGIQATNTTGPTHNIIGGTPREPTSGGFCGDGIINGTTEDCDQGAIQNTSCRDYGGVSGEVTCQPKTCLYDISKCITPAVDEKIGGIAETCKCNCNTSSCRGGCRPTAATGQSLCLYQCDNDCTCQCEGKLQAAIENCEFRCACTVDAAGFPACECSLDNCDLLNTVSKNIATLVSSY